MSFLFLKDCNVIKLKEGQVQRCSILINNERFFKIMPRHGRNEDFIFNFKKSFANIKIIDLKNKYILPGFTDSHTHLLAYGIELQRVDLSKCASPDECLDKLSSERNREIVFGVNWDDSCWTRGKKEDLNRTVLDQVSKIKPVIMRRVCGHFAICNTKALESIPEDWRIVDRKNGWLYEDAALYLNKIFKPTFEMYKEGLELAMRKALSMGITSINEITDINGFKIYQKIKKFLKLRVALYLTDGFSPAIASGIQSNYGDEFLKFSGIKLFMDGSIGALTAGVRKPYHKTRKYGKILISDQRLLKYIRNAEEHSLQLMIHSIGDRSTDLVLKMFKKAKIGKNPLRHRLEHIEILDKRQIEEIRQLDLIASMQPNFLRWQIPGNMYEKYLGKRYKKMNCFKLIKDAGIKLVFGSDCMPLGPFYGIIQSVSSPFKESNLTPAEAITLYTEAPPYATFDEDTKGKIEEGKIADFIVLNKNPLIKENLENLKILMVFVGGNQVY
jgi:predicted amidohydrolase YtcJ